MIGGEIGGRSGTRPARARRCRCPTAARAGRASCAAATRTARRRGRGSAPGRPRCRPARRGGRGSARRGGHRDVDARGAQVGDEDVARLGAEGQLTRRPAAGARAEVALGTSPRSISSPTRCATTARPRPVRATSSERDRERPSRISSRTVTRASSASSGNGRPAGRRQHVGPIGGACRSDYKAGDHTPLYLAEADFCT